MPCALLRCTGKQQALFFPSSHPVPEPLDNHAQSASTTMLGVQSLLGLPFLDPASQAVAASASAGALSGGVIEEGEGGMAGLRVGEGKVLTAQESLALMLANIHGLAEHKVRNDGCVCVCVGGGYGFEE